MACKAPWYPDPVLGAPPEGRRNARVSSNFWIGLDGQDSELNLRRGNLSRSGVYFECDRPQALVGSRHLLSLASEDRALFVRVPGRIVRVQENRGVAIELEPADDAASHGLGRLVRHCVDIGLGYQPAIESSGQFEEVALETRLPAAIGDRVHLEIHSPDTLDGLRYHGQVRSVTLTHSSPRLAIELQIANPVDTIDDLLIDENMIDVSPQQPDFEGKLGPIRVPSLLSMLEMDKLSGTLCLRCNGYQVVLWIREGRLIDCEEMHQKIDPSQLMQKLIGMEEGDFVFAANALDHTPRFERSLTWLVLDAAQSVDEANL